MKALKLFCLLVCGLILPVFGLEKEGGKNETEKPKLPSPENSDMVGKMIEDFMDRATVARRGAKIQDEYLVTCAGSFENAIQHYESFVQRQLHNKTKQREVFLDCYTAFDKLVQYTRNDKYPNVVEMFFRFQSQISREKGEFREYTIQIIKVFDDVSLCRLTKAMSYKPEPPKVQMATNTEYERRRLLVASGMTLFSYLLFIVCMAYTLKFYSAWKFRKERKKLGYSLAEISYAASLISEKEISEEVIRNYEENKLSIWKIFALDDVLCKSISGVKLIRLLNKADTEEKKNEVAAAPPAYDMINQEDKDLEDTKKDILENAFVSIVINKPSTSNDADKLLK